MWTSGKTNSNEKAFTWITMTSLMMTIHIPSKPGSPCSFASNKTSVGAYFFGKHFCKRKEFTETYVTSTPCASKKKKKKKRQICSSPFYLFHTMYRQLTQQNPTLTNRPTRSPPPMHNVHPAFGTSIPACHCPPTHRFDSAIISPIFFGYCNPSRPESLPKQPQQQQQPYLQTSKL
ncbi:uncharacterized protein BYT42DRAFT_32704 [Radiomyces spectabilis]|uniref:uncharacterized protein n=1 Tax=Radiomyces spectabilis TaxID=64574 RepID=UPI00221EC70F|nr:uncharacterized protein BYT42DRAFT_32704 [Radiomyces spectabilis]KAI8394148.1 hypothetical protein BYT42DRAFT_32704 [Radiomyces spectabilis]